MIAGIAFNENEPRHDSARLVFTGNLLAEQRSISEVETSVVRSKVNSPSIPIGIAVWISEAIPVSVITRVVELSSQLTVFVAKSASVNTAIAILHASSRNAAIPSRSLDR